MSTTIDAIDAKMIPSVALTAATRLPHVTPTVKPDVLILQPGASLHQANSREFQQALESALEQVTDAVIVDLLWVGLIDVDGIAALVTALQRATALGKRLSFESMSDGDRLALETAWAHQQAIGANSWQGTFSSDFEAFLDHFTHG